MAPLPSKTCRQNGSGGSSSQAKTQPHFFKIIHSAVDPHQKLRIPKKFMNQYGMNLGNHVFLKVPSGTVWEVELERSDGEVLMNNGWKEFAQYYSMGFGHLLVFRYDGNCNFDVLIFDKSASEIEYQLVTATRGEQTNANINGTSQIPKTEDVIEVDDSVETLGDIPSGRYNTKRKEIYGRGEFEKLGIQSRQKTRKIYHDKENLEKGDSVEILDDSLGRDFTASEKGRGNTKFGMQNNPTMREFPPDIQYSEGLKLPKQEKDVETRNEAEEYPGDKSIEERRHQSQIPVKIPSASPSMVNSSALERARDFKSKKPFFMVQMTPSYVSGRARVALYVPINFARKYLKDCQKNIILGISDGKTLSLVKCYAPASGRRDIEWGPFARDNNLKAGDICVFELISMGIEPQLDVTIIPK